MKLCSTETAFTATIKPYIRCQVSRTVEGISGLFQCILVSSIILRLLSLLGNAEFLLDCSEDGSTEMHIKLFSLCGITDKHSHEKKKIFEI